MDIRHVSKNGTVEERDGDLPVHNVSLQTPDHYYPSRGGGGGWLDNLELFRDPRHHCPTQRNFKVLHDRFQFEGGGDSR